jgi:hypothetical protein
VPRRDCRPPRGYDRPGGDHHAAGRVAGEQQDVPGERAPEAPTRLDRRSHHDELGVTLRSDARDVLAEGPRPRPDDLPPDRDSVRARYRGRRLEPLLQLGERTVEMRVQRQLALEHCRRDEHDARATVGREPAREDERVLRLLLIEERDNDAAIGNRLRPQREAPGAPP